MRVVEFSAGRIAVTGAKNEDDDYVLGRIRQQPGAPIDAQALSEDLDWLNRNPFRTARALFSPGDALGRSDLTLAPAETRPWRVYAGAANSGAASTGRTRLFAGIRAAPIPGLPDAVFAYQFTASDDVFDAAHPAYVSHAGLADIGIAARSAICASASRRAMRNARCCSATCRSSAPGPTSSSFTAASRRPASAHWATMPPR